MSLVTNASLSAALLELSKLVAKVEDLPDMSGFAPKEKWYELTLEQSARYDLDANNKLKVSQGVPSDLLAKLLDGTYAGIKAKDPSMSGTYYLLRTCGTSTSGGWAGMSSLANDQTMIWAWLNNDSLLEVRAKVLW